MCYVLTCDVLTCEVLTCDVLTCDVLTCDVRGAGVLCVGPRSAASTIQNLTPNPIAGRTTSIAAPSVSRISGIITKRGPSGMSTPPER